MQVISTRKGARNCHSHAAVGSQACDKLLSLGIDPLLHASLCSLFGLPNCETGSGTDSQFGFALATSGDVLVSSTPHAEAAGAVYAFRTALPSGVLLVDHAFCASLLLGALIFKIERVEVWALIAVR